MTKVHESDQATRGEAMSAILGSLDAWAAAHREATIALEAVEGGRWRVVVEGGARRAERDYERRKRCFPGIRRAAAGRRRGSAGRQATSRAAWNSERMQPQCPEHR